MKTKFGFFAAVAPGLCAAARVSRTQPCKSAMLAAASNKSHSQIAPPRVPARFSGRSAFMPVAPRSFVLTMCFQPRCPKCGVIRLTLFDAQS